MKKPVTEVMIELVPRRTLGGNDLWGVRITIPTYRNERSGLLGLFRQRRWYKPIVTYAGLTSDRRETAFPKVFPHEPFLGSLKDAETIANLIRNEPSDHYKVKPVCLDGD